MKYKYITYIILGAISSVVAVQIFDFQANQAKYWIIFLLMFGSFIAGRLHQHIFNDD